MLRAKLTRALTLSCVFTLLLTLPVRAEEQPSSPSPRPLQERNESIKEAQREFREDRKDAMEDRRETKDKEEFRESLQDAREDRKASISGARQEYRSERARIHGERLARRFALYQDRFEDISQRLQERITALSSAGKNTAAASNLLAIAQDTLQTAVSEGDKAVGMFASIQIATWDTQKPEVKAAIEQAQKAQKAFSQVKKDLMAVTTALRALK